MRAALRRPGQCAFCAFRTSEWTPSSFNWQNGSRRHRSNVKSSFSERGSVFGGEQPTVITPRWTFGGTRDRDGRGRYGFNDRYSKNRDGFRDRQNTYGKATTQPSPKQSAYDTFGELLMRECGFLKHKLLTSSDSPTKSWGFTSTSHFKAEFGRFTEDVIAAAQKASSHRIVSKEKNPLFAQLREAFIRGNIGGLAAELKYRFLASTIPESSTEPTLAFQQKVADLRHPVEWYPKTRALQRTIHLHVGPTNSGKTYHALKRLEEAKTGIYAGPLRLLAHEVYTRFNAKGKKCALITGEERRIPEGLDVMMHSCTVEMVPLNAKVEVAVIDEIQMMGDEERGWAWTQAFMGVEATEVHLCGELRTVQLISKLCTAMGDKLVIHKYERLGPLKLESRSLDGNLKKLQKGDAMILFSRVAIHAMKSNIEKLTGKRCAVVYGSLPPETRASQAALFNDPNNDYDFLVASNAVGMGLNLSIKRIIFESVSKHDGYAHRILKVPEINQIAGRAGRFKSAHQDVQRASTEVANDGSSLDVPKWDSKPNVGLVTTLNQFDFPTIEKGMSAQVEPLPTAGLLPPSDIIAKFASFFPSDTPFSYIILRLNELAP
ncbi:hypothetical protein G7Y89_g2698 [Cudoniella acicularis]|uniref:RNA helicase n=1 Tax=Cudoniella acicularis TaxID=354080 RepID=A0A8H4RSW6_9HELO|nr:hypothetical protein G7Y89_g2698 [Cudoniella acicularis]